MKNKLVILICILFLLNSVYAGVISGKIDHNDLNYKQENKIVDSKTNEPISNAKITIPEINYSTYTNSDGNLGFFIAASNMSFISKDSSSTKYLSM